MAYEYHQKWGFGMAPIKPDVQRRRLEAVRMVLGILSNIRLDEITSTQLDSVSEVKGLFNRINRQDQWDWFTVSGQLGYPSQHIAGVIGRYLDQLRIALRDHSSEADRFLNQLRRLPIEKCLRIFAGELTLSSEPGAGWLYVLSNRETPDLIKVGQTARSSEERVKEINTGTGVPIPYGVRHCWWVSNPIEAEDLAHDALREHRFRSDREFFKVDFYRAKQIIQHALDSAGLELRTLDNLGSLE